jgi:hypothetical protein
MQKVWTSRSGCEWEKKRIGYLLRCLVDFLLFSIHGEGGEGVRDLQDKSRTSNENYRLFKSWSRNVIELKAPRLPHKREAWIIRALCALVECMYMNYVSKFQVSKYVLFSAGSRAIMTKLLSLLLWPCAPTNLSTAIKAQVHFSRVKFGTLRQKSMKQNALGKIGHLNETPHSSAPIYT